MALTVEDGTGLVGADSYVSVADCETYCDARGLTFSGAATADKEAALRRATASIDAMYRSRFRARDASIAIRRLNGREPALLMLTASSFRMTLSPSRLRWRHEGRRSRTGRGGSMLPDLERGGAIKSISAGSVSIEYGASAKPGTAMQIIDGILAGLIGSAARYSGEAKRVSPLSGSPC